MVYNLVGWINSVALLRWFVLRGKNVKRQTLFVHNPYLGMPIPYQILHSKTTYNLQLTLTTDKQRFDERLRVRQWTQWLPSIGRCKPEAHNSEYPELYYCRTKSHQRYKMQMNRTLNEYQQPLLAISCWNPHQSIVSRSRLDLNVNLDTLQELRYWIRLGYALGI